MKLFCFARSAATPCNPIKPALKCFPAAGLWVLLLSVTAFSQTGAPVISCESLARLALPDTTITMAQTVAAGEFKVPAARVDQDRDGAQDRGRAHRHLRRLPSAGSQPR